MSDTARNFCMIHVPTWRERFWRKLGFRFHLGEDQDSPDDPNTGWMMTETDFRFGFGDRLRLLLTGHLRVRTVHDIDTPSPNRIKTRVDWQIYAPGEKP